MPKRTLLLTTTGEPYQPVRLRWKVPGRAYCLQRLMALRCVGEDLATKALTVWLTAETLGLSFASTAGLPSRPAQPLPTGHLVILGTFRFPDASSLLLEVRSVPRAIELARLLRPILGAAAKLTRVRVVNRWFDASEGADALPELDRCLDRDVTVVRWEDTAAELDAFLAKGKTPEERRALHEAWSQARRHLDVPLVEDYQCHPEEETEAMQDLATGLQFRLLRAGRVWGGERVTLRQVIEESVAKLPPLPGT